MHISIQRWNSSRADDVNAVSVAQKEMLWTDIKALYAIKDEHEQLVKQWAMKKMVVLFQHLKTSLYSTYRKIGHATDFYKYPKYRDHWP